MTRKLFFLLMFVFAMAAHAQVVDIEGIVTDTESSPLIGVNVVVKGTGTGTVTDLDGKFSLKGENGQTLVFSYVGMLDKEVVYKGKLLRIVMEDDSKALDEVIVVGYGTQKKSVVTAAIGSVSAEDLGRETPTRIDNLLKGRTSGISITAASGQPGDGNKVRIRGIGTINNSDPLYIIDGMPVEGGIDYLNPTDIQSIEILKDAASAAVYGSRAANGVILVTTKEGKAGRVKVNYNFQIGWQNPWKHRDVLNAMEYETLMNESYANANPGADPLFDNPALAGKGTDWQKEVFNKNAPIMNHQLSISGGNDRNVYYLSVGYLSQDGIVGGNYDRSNYDRLNVRLNNTYTVFDSSKERRILNSLKIGTNASYSRIESVGVGTNDVFGSPLGSALLLSPTVSVYAEDPEATLAMYPAAVKDKRGRVYTVVGPDYNEITNPIASMELPGEKNATDKFIANFFAELQLIDNLKFKTTYGADFSFNSRNGYLPEYYLGQSALKSESEVWSGMNRAFTWQVENTLSYNKTFAGKHSLTVLLGQSAKKYTYRHLWGKNYRLQAIDPDKANLNFAQGTKADQETDGGASNSTLASYFGRLSYNYREKYMFEATVRRDGSSNFGPNHRWATFPSVSAGWAITEENFLQNRPEWLSSLKLRASWGKNGNERIEAFRYTSTVIGGNNYVFGNTVTGNSSIFPGSKPNGLSNADLKWEESEQTNIGLDAKFLQGALTFSFDWYTKKTIGMLMTMPLPDYIGDAQPLGNCGDMKNSGVEFDFSYKFRLSDWSFHVSGNASYLNNVLLNLGNEKGWANYDDILTVGTITRAENGEPFPYFYGKRTNGIFQTEAEVEAYVNKNGEKIQPNAHAGDVRFVDINNDGQINDEDRVKLGKGMPDWTYGFSLGVEWKGFDFNATFQGVAGCDIYDGTRRIDLKRVNLPGYMMGRWHGEGTSNRIPRMNEADQNGNWLSSDLFIFNGSYLRLKNVQLGYTLPQSLIRKAYINNLRFYVSAENLLTFTSYPGLDPEISSGGTSLGVDRGIYPQSRTISLGVNIAF